MAAEAYCTKCHAKREIRDAKVTTLANGRNALQGVRPACGAKLTRCVAALAAAAPDQDVVRQLREEDDDGLGGPLVFADGRQGEAMHIGLELGPSARSPIVVIDHCRQREVGARRDQDRMAVAVGALRRRGWVAPGASSDLSDGAARTGRRTSRPGRRRDRP